MKKILLNLSFIILSMPGIVVGFIVSGFIITLLVDLFTSLSYLDWYNQIPKSFHTFYSIIIWFFSAYFSLHILDLIFKKLMFNKFVLSAISVLIFFFFLLLIQGSWIFN